METKPSLSRRSFLKRSAATGMALAAPLVVPGHVLGRGAAAPSERIALGVIGYGGRCGAILPHFLMFDDVQCVAVSDCRASRLAAAKQVVDAHYGNQDCAAYADFRELLARPDIDAVLIATGDRWHTPLSILAAKSGKDIYCEKPVSLTIGEGRALVDTMARYGTVYQAGHQRRSVGSYRFQVEAARSGMIGKVHTVICQVWEGPTVALDKPRPVPAGFDYDMWLGPTPWHPYTDGLRERLELLLGHRGRAADRHGLPLHRYRPVGPAARRHRPRRLRGHGHVEARRLQRNARDRRLLLHLRRRREDRPPLQRHFPGPLHPVCRVRGLGAGGR